MSFLRFCVGTKLQIELYLKFYTVNFKLSKVFQTSKLNILNIKNQLFLYVIVVHTHINRIRIRNSLFSQFYLIRNETKLRRDDEIEIIDLEKKI